MDNAVLTAKYLLINVSTWDLKETRTLYEMWHNKKAINQVF